MMAKVLYLVGLLSLSAAGTLFAYCGKQWTRGTPQAEGEAEVSLVEGIQALRGAGTQGGEAIESPLIAQAQAFALYLDPPKPPAPPATVVRAEPPAPRPPSTAPKFRLLSISYNRSRPEESLALVSEPGIGGHWVKKGALLGHLRLESINAAGIVYRDGGQLHELPIEVKPTVQLARRRSEDPASAPAAEQAVARQPPTRPVEPPVTQTARQTPRQPVPVQPRPSQSIRPSLRLLKDSR